MLPARAFPIKRVVQQLFNVCLIGKTFSGRQVLCQRYIRHGQTDGDRPHQRPVHRGTDPPGLIRLIGNIAQIDVDVADRIQRRELFLWSLVGCFFFIEFPFRRSRFSRGDNTNDGLLF